MGREIERKFLVQSDAWRAGATGEHFRQGFLSTEPERTVRVRVAGSRAWLTIKSKTVGATRSEYEYEIPLRDAEQMLDALCHRPLIEKTRYRVPVASHTWEVDVFSGENDGLVIAEVELEDEQDVFERPAWVGDEVTHDPRYFNSNLVRAPYRTWGR